VAQLGRAFFIQLKCCAAWHLVLSQHTVNVFLKRKKFGNTHVSFCGIQSFLRLFVYLPYLEPLHLRLKNAAWEDPRGLF